MKKPGESKNYIKWVKIPQNFLSLFFDNFFSRLNIKSKKPFWGQSSPRLGFFFFEQTVFSTFLKSVLSLCFFFSKKPWSPFCFFLGGGISWPWGFSQLSKKKGGKFLSKSSLYGFFYFSGFFSATSKEFPFPTFKKTQSPHQKPKSKFPLKFGGEEGPPKAFSL